MSTSELRTFVISRCETELDDDAVLKASRIGLKCRLAATNQKSMTGFLRFRSRESERCASSFCTFTMHKVSHQQTRT